MQIWRLGQQWAAETGREPDELVADAMEGCFQELRVRARCSTPL